ncbi:hypothetical protein PTNB73_05874 [Pyrenophora teres f. teres]|nr:hypothetical protein PTNB73_05874 [Pyrenophora teres f. teres]
MAANDKKVTTITTEERSSRDSLDIRTPRAARFAEATSVHSPVDPPRSPIEYPTNHYKPQPQIADTGFGFMQQSVEMEETDRRYLPPPTPKTPLKSALKSPEHQLEKREALTDKEQAKDLKIKVRVRLAKIFLRGINFACSLIVLSMVASAFAIFNATKTLAPRNGLPAWANNTKIWPQVLLLSIACISLLMSIVVIIAYWRGGHHRAEKVAAYYTVFAVAFFIFSIIMWAVGAAVFNQSKAQNNNKDMWGWSCVDNKRRHLFEDDVAYSLVCRLQNWALVCCIIEIVVEVLVIAIYGVVFYRFWSKRHPMYVDPHSAAEAGESDKVQYAYAREIAQPQPFTLQAPPIKITGATPKVEQNGFDAPPRAHTVSPPLASPSFQERRNEHVGAAPGEQQYAAVPIPGAYTPLASPSYPPPQQQPTGFDFGASVTGQR